jgi:hypothetical protein
VWTLIGYAVHNSYWDIITLANPDANNHILNTVLVKAIHGLFPGIWQLSRIPNVIGFVLYCFFFRKIIIEIFQTDPKPKKAKWLFFLSAVVFICNPFMLDFFSIARGYGLSLGLLTGAIYFNLKSIQFPQKRNFIGFYAGSFLAVVSNLTLIYPLGALVLTALIFVGKQHIKSFLKVSGVFAIPIIPWIGSYVIKLQKSNSLYYGGNNNFFSDTVISLAKTFFYNKIPEEYLPIIIVALIAMVVVLFWGFLKQIFKSPRFFHVKFYLVILIILVFGINLHHYAFSSLFVIDRGAMFFFPFFSLLVISFAYATWEILKTKLVFSFLSLIILVNLLANINFKHTYLWYFDAPSKQILTCLNAAAQDEKISFSFSWPLQNSITFYYNTGAFPNLESAFDFNERDAFPPAIDYFILFSGKLGYIQYQPHQIDLKDFGYVETCSFPEYNISIYKKR